MSKLSKTAHEYFLVALVLACALFVAVTGVQSAERVAPVAKSGQCPSDYRQSGGYCAPTTRDAPLAIRKTDRKQCPSGFRQSGWYCVEMR
jgi:hypothetical protein